MSCKLRILSVLSFVLASSAPAVAGPIELQSVAYPERSSVELPMVASERAPRARIDTEVTYRKGQANITFAFEKMKPAILYGGDVTCYVVWAVTRDGNTENLGELLTRKASGRLSFSTGQKNFALLVTAESFYLVKQPSDLVIFRNVAPLDRPELASAFEFDGFAPAVDHGMDSIAAIKWDSKFPLELLQARKAFELAGRNGAAQHAPVVYAEAEESLNNANKLAHHSPNGRELLDFARRAVAASNEALNMSLNRIEALRMEEQIAQRRGEIATLETRAAEAERQALEAQRLSDSARSEAERIRAERERMASETAALRQEKAAIESVMGALRQEKFQLESEAAMLREEKNSLELRSQQLQQESDRLKLEKSEIERASAQLRSERDELSGRLQSALSHVAETTGSARGYVVNLPDILFAVNESTLKTEAQLVLAKLAGILLIMPEQTISVEGHTDSTGSSEYNLELSRRRAHAVLDLLIAQGVDPKRLQATGYGMGRPVADNTTAAGRSKNRRVEIVISDGSSSGSGN